MKRRSLVITDETARHPFLASLPPHIRKGTEARAFRRRNSMVYLRDWRDFFSAYCASFLAVTLYFA